MCKHKQHMLCKLQKICVNQKAWFAYPEGHVNHDVPQAVPSLAPPRVYQSPRGAGARLAGPNKLFFGGLILQKLALGPVLPRP